MHPAQQVTCSLLAVVTCGRKSGSEFRLFFMFSVVSIANMDADTQRTLDGEGNLMIGSLGASVTLGVILFDLLSLIFFIL